MGRTLCGRVDRLGGWRWEFERMAMYGNSSGIRRRALYDYQAVGSGLEMVRS